MRFRLPRLLVLVVLCALAPLVLSACGGDDDETGATTGAATATTASAEETYVNALSEATSATGDLAAATISGDDGATVASDIRTALGGWSDAIDAMAELDLEPQAVGDQRDALVAASPAYVDAWTSVADEFENGTANGLLELAQRRAPIGDGTQALASAIQGAAEEAGSQAKEQLDELSDQVGDAIDEIQGAE